MTDMERKAREIAGEVYARLSNDGDYAGDINTITTALAEARREALEEAAGIIGALPWDVTSGSHVAQESIRAIRSLIESGGEDVTARASRGLSQDGEGEPETDDVRLIALGWSFVQIGPNEWGWLKFNEQGQSCARQGDAIWREDLASLTPTGKAG